MNQTIRIEYCRASNYEPRALRARDQLRKAYGVEVEIRGGRSGSFEITRGEDLLFSKLERHRFPEDEEILHLLDPR